jgi:two-component system sensor histidine kinase YesM
MIISMLLPLLLMVLLALLILGYYEMQYAQITRNVNISSKFNLDFKETIDLKMYYYAVGSKQQTTLPISDVEDAIKLAESLKESTIRKESRRTLQNILDYCSNLEKKMYMISETRDYDSRMQQLDINIYVLTKLIQGKMIDYIYYEVGYMSSLEQKMTQDIQSIMILALVIGCGTVVTLLIYGLRFSKSIANPVQDMCNNVNRVGGGEFIIPQIETNYSELSQLNSGIQQMARRISLLLESVKEEEKLQHKMQLQLLQAQINPHFLYNTLDTIMWLVESEQHAQAVTMISNLSVFFRTILSKGNDMISLEEEIMHTRSYLDIQQVRYQDILEYHITLPEQLRGVRIPKLTLQPLAENALYHGVKEKRGKSRIDIVCIQEQEDIILTVGDNGVGMRPEKLNAIRDSLEHSERVGFGLSAVHERIRLYFGENYGIEVDSAYGSGTTVKVRLPKKFEQL